MERLERFYKIDQLLKERKVVPFAAFKEALETRSGRLRSVTESGCRGALRAGGSLDEIVENVALHALDLQPVAGAELGPFLRPCALAEVLEQALQPRRALSCHRQFPIVADHPTSNMPRFFAAP